MVIESPFSLLDLRNRLECVDTERICIEDNLGPNGMNEKYASGAKDLADDAAKCISVLMLLYLPVESSDSCPHKTASPQLHGVLW